MIFKRFAPNYISYIPLPYSTPSLLCSNFSTSPFLIQRHHRKQEEEKPSNTDEKTTYEEAKTNKDKKQDGDERNKKGGQKQILKEKPEKKTGLQKFLPTVFLNMMGLSMNPRNPPPTNLGWLDERTGSEQMDPDIPLDELIEEAPKWYKQQTKLYLNELKEGDYYQLLKKGLVRAMDEIEFPSLHNDNAGPAHGETIVQYEFKTGQDIQKWVIGCDSDWSEGYSKCELYKSDRGTAIFEGNLSTRLVKDGRTDRAGWCAMRSIRDTKSFARKRHFADWAHYSHLIIKLRGDGRSYKVLLHTPEYFDVTWGDSHSYPLHTHGGPYWQYECIPFSRFIHTVSGRVMDIQHPVLRERISSVGITLMDRLEGPFRLEIAFIGVTNHVSHTEKFAHEVYNLPLIHPEF